MTGRKLPGAQFVQGRKVLGAEKFLWKVDGLAQRGLWYWMLADVAEDFTVNWTSALMRSVDCIGIEVGGVIRTNPVAGVIGSKPFGLVDVGTIEEEWGNVTSTDRTFLAPAGFTGNISFSGRWTPELPGTPPGSLVVSSPLGYQASPPARLDPDTGNWLSTLTLPIVGGVTYTIGLLNISGWSTWYDLEVVFIVRGGPTP